MFSSARPLPRIQAATGTPAARKAEETAATATHTPTFARKALPSSRQQRRIAPR